MWKENYEKWLNNANLDEELKVQLSILDEEQLKECFYKDVDFGTAGMRGVMQVGTNKINVHTITRASIGLAKFILENDYKNKRVVIAYDSRINSKKFAITAAKVLASFDIEVKIFKSVASTPVASFAMRELEACNGIVITASHNPKSDNGFKVYNLTGAQLNLEEGASLSKLVAETTDYLDFKITESAKDKIEFIDESVIETYQQKLLGVEVNKTNFENTKFVFSPLFGTSWKFVDQAAKNRNMNFVEVKSQVQPDGNFPGLTYPNPESKDAFVSGIEIAKILDADAVFATDPDADRLGIAVKHNDEYVFLNGNEQGILASVYLLNAKALSGDINDKSLLLSSIVSTHLVDKICEAYGCGVEHVLTGFKFIGEKIEKYNTTGEKEFVFGFEESYGCLVKDFARDKDAIQATMLFAEMIAHYKEENMSLVDVLNIIYSRFGFSKNLTLSYTFEGESGIETMKEIMTRFRDISVIETDVTPLDVRTDFLNDETSLPKADMIEYHDQDNQMYIYLRPSGTEPKLKVYIEIINADEQAAENTLNFIKDRFDKLIANVNKNV